ncbi:hypothetical protein F4808DRAFT_457299 [Astrocystis sublimbata]|nr:hypothetical protein F4808DRAFT_457299 [Astrocystis sublimbata]
MRICGPNGQTGSIWVQNYPGATSILRTTAKAFTVAKPGVCATLGVVGLLNLDPKVDWVAEHVFEKREFRDAVEWMVAGKTATGTALTAGASPLRGVFDANGIFQENWPTANFPSLTVVKGWAGNINDTFTGLLGRTTDAGLNNANIVNLQVCDADFNRYKEYAVAGADFISQKGWTAYNALERVGILSDVVDSFSYRAENDVPSSYQKTYAALLQLWGDFGRYAATKGINYDFASAWEQVVPAVLEIGRCSRDVLASRCYEYDQ